MALGATLLGVVGQAVPGLACGYHGGLGGGLAPAHPRSIEVAIAVRDALDRQVIEAPPRLPALTQFARIGRWLEQVRQRLAVAGDPEPPLPPIALVLIESRLWARYSPHDGKVALAPHVEGPTTGDVVVLTGEPVLKGLLDGSISGERAIAEGILVVSGSATSNARVEETLRRAFDRSASSPPAPHKVLHQRQVADRSAGRYFLAGAGFTCAAASAALSAGGGAAAATGGGTVGCTARPNRRQWPPTAW